MRKILFIFASLVLTASYAGWADELRVTSSVEKDQVQIDEEVGLTVRISGSRGNLQAPRLPAIQGFDSFYTGRTSQFTFVNGKSTSTVEFNYVLVPKVAGRFTVPSIEVWIEGKSYQTPPILVEVLAPQIQSPPAAAPAPVGPAPRAAPPFAGFSPQPPIAQPAGIPPAKGEDENIFVKAWVDKSTVFPNEQILLTYTLYTRYDTHYEGFEEDPSVSGFWIEDFPLDRDLGREAVSVEGKRYLTADIRKIALFPTAPAQYTIQPGVLKVSVQQESRTSSLFDEFFNDSFFSGAGFFAKRVERLLKPEPITVTVKPFPETGRPASFNGAVGRFRLDASVDKKEVKQNEPLSLKLVLEGEGNIETLSKPSIPVLSGFKVYDGDSTTQLFKAGTTLAGKKTFEIIFIPTESGALAIPPLEFSYFDPRSQSYQIVRTPSFALQVTPSEEPFRLPAELAEKPGFKKEVQVEAKDIRYLHEELPSERKGRLFRVLSRVFLVGNFLGILAVGNGLLRKRRAALFAKDISLKRRKLARSIALRGMKALRRLVRSEKEEDSARFMEEAEKVLSGYLSNKFNVSAYHFTRQWLEDTLTSLWGAEDPLLKRVQKFYDLSAESRFGRGGIEAAQRREICELLEAVIRRVEKGPVKLNP